MDNGLALLFFFFHAKMTVWHIMACLCFDVQSVSMDAPLVGFSLAPWQS